MGFEARWLLRPVCLPFHHPGVKWCAREDSNLHPVSRTSPSSWRVCRSTTGAKLFGNVKGPVTLLRLPSRYVLVSYRVPPWNAAKIWWGV